MKWEQYVAVITAVITLAGILLWRSWRLRRVDRIGGHKVIQVYKILAPKEKLRAMPENERALLILLGYAANQLNFFSKLVILSSNRDGDNETERQLSAAQTQMALRIVIGVLNETWELIRRRFMGAPCGKEYTPLLDARGAEAFVKLKQTFGSAGVFAQLRNAWIFHHPYETDAVTQAFEDAAANPEWDKEWAWFFSHSNYNSFFFVSEFVALHGISKIIGAAEEDEEDDENEDDEDAEEENDINKAQKKLLKLVTSVSEEMNHLNHAIIAVLWQKYFAAELLAERRIDITDAPGFYDVWVPFFVEIPNEQPAPPTKP